MLLMIIGILIFLGVHLVPTQTDLRDGLVARFGRGPYMLAFSALSAIGLIVIAFGVAKLQLNPGKDPVLWNPPVWTRHIAFALMLPAIILLVAAYVPSNIRTIVRHPMLLAIKLWALAHLIANGDLGGMILFGSFLAFAIYDRISVKKRVALGPLGAREGGIGGDITAVVLGTALYAFLLFYGHWLIIGKALLPSHA